MKLSTKMESGCIIVLFALCQSEVEFYCLFPIFLRSLPFTFTISVKKQPLTGYKETLESILVAQNKVVTYCAQVDLSHEHAHAILLDLPYIDKENGGGEGGMRRHNFN